MTGFEQKVLKTIREKRLLSGGESILIALSGGADSMALLHTIIALQPMLNLRVAAAHFNHCQRGEESDQDEDFVRLLCRSLGIHLESKKLEVPGSAAANLESFLRHKRYEFLAERALRSNSVVATGHTLDDQAETFLLKLVRGSGLSGLSGIKPFRKHLTRLGSTVTVIRPLIEIRKNEILDYLMERRLEYREDSSNRLLDYDRNWMRHHLIPIVEERLNPQLTRALARSSHLFSEIQSFLDIESENWISSNSTSDGDDRIVQIGRLELLHPAMQKEVIRSLIHGVKGDKENITAQHVEDILGLCDRASGKQVHLPGSIRVLREFEHLRFTSRGVTIPDFCYQIRIPGEIFIQETAKKVSVRPAGNKSRFPSFCTTRDQLTIRNRRPGDEYPTGFHQKSRSLKRLFIDMKIPLSCRSRLLVFECEEKIVWVEGLAPLDFDEKTGQKRYEIEVGGGR